MVRLSLVFRSGKEPCGLAPQFYSSVSVRFGTRKFTKG